MEKKRLDKKKIKNANQNFKKNFFETDDDNHLSGYEVFYIFMICNVIGYCVEMVFCYLKHGYWESRQSLIYGPFGLAYGIGGVLLSYLLFKDTKKAWWKVFIKSYLGHRCRIHLFPWRRAGVRSRILGLQQNAA